MFFHCLLFTSTCCSLLPPLPGRQFVGDRHVRAIVRRDRWHRWFGHGAGRVTQLPLRAFVADLGGGESRGETQR